MRSWNNPLRHDFCHERIVRNIACPDTAGKGIGQLDPKEISSLFNLQNKGAVAEMVANNERLKKHYSVVNIGQGKPV